jgi:hypothetical protein
VCAGVAGTPDFSSIDDIAGLCGFVGDLEVASSTECCFSAPSVGAIEPSSFRDGL